MDAIWAPENRYRIWFDIEALAAEGMARIGAIPETAARAIRERAAPGSPRSAPPISTASTRSSGKRATT